MFLIGHGYAVGASGRVYKTNTASVFSSWSTITSPATFQINGVATLDGTVVYVVGASGNVYKYSGTSWTKQMSSVTSESLYSISMVSNNEVFISGGANFVAKTINGGTTWSTLSVFTSGTTTYTRPPHAISMLTSSVVLVGSASGSIRQTITSGVKWTDATSLASSAGRSILCLYVFSSNVGIAGE